MAWLAKIWNTFRPGRLDGDLEEELRHHRELRAHDLEKSGMPRGRGARGSVLAARQHHFAKGKDARNGHSYPPRNSR